MPPKFFITHSWQDIDFARRLSDDLIAYGLEGFFDAYSVKPGDDIAGSIGRGLENCEVYIPFLSQASVASKWCEFEIDTAINLSLAPERKGRPHIIPVVIEKVQVPTLLRGKLYIDFTSDYDNALKELLTNGLGVSPKVIASKSAQSSREIGGKLADKDIPLFAETFRIENTSARYYSTPYFQKHRNQLQPIPPPVMDPPRMELADVVGRADIQSIHAAKKISFHAVGDTGAAKQSGPATESLVANMMAADVQLGGAIGPAFFFHLGDVVFYFGESQYYYDQFYAPFQNYPRPIFAIPGNHDGAVHDAAVPTLQAFLRNFCAPQPAHSPDAGGLMRSVMTQPGVYFTLDAPFVSIIGLYSNVLEGPGVISSEGGKQLNFLQAELERLKPYRMANERAIIVAVHHPPLSTVNPSGSASLSKDIDTACHKTGLWPDAILSSHAHLYQRFTRRVGKQSIPYIVCGTGGYGLSRPAVEIPKAPFTVGDATLEIDPVLEFGYLTVTVDMTSAVKQLTIAFHSPALGHNVDHVTIDLVHREIIRTTAPIKSPLRKKSGRGSLRRRR